MFPLRRRQFIFSHYRPSVFFIYKNFPCTHINHRFDSENHTWNQQHTCSFSSIMQYIRLFMKLNTSSMSTQIANYRKSVLFSMFFYCISNISDKEKGCAAFMPISKHSLATRTSFSFSGVVLPIINMRDASA